MKTIIQRFCKTAKARIISIANDQSGASSIVDIIVGLLVAVAIGAAILLAVRAWAPTFFQDVLDFVRTELGF